jgi:glutamine phosphoribosylpyrophosphate amidotransferase
VDSLRARWAWCSQVPVLAAQVGLFAFRDPFGIRPLVLGTRVSEEGPEWCFASEDCAFGPLGFVKARPGVRACCQPRR